MRNQALTVLGEDRWHPGRVVHGQADEPAKQQVVLGLLHQQAFRANAVEDLQEHGAQQLLWRNAGTPTFDVGCTHALEQELQIFQRLIDHFAHGTQWIVIRYEVILTTHGEQAFGEGTGCAHGLVILGFAILLCLTHL